MLDEYCEDVKSGLAFLLLYAAAGAGAYMVRLVQKVVGMLDEYRGEVENGLALPHPQLGADAGA